MTLWKMNWKRRKTSIVNIPEDRLIELQLGSAGEMGVALGNISDVKTERDW